MKYSVTIDVPNLDEGLRFYRDALGLVELARPIATYVILKCGGSQIGLMEKSAGTKPAKVRTTRVDINVTGLPFTSTSTSKILNGS